MTWPKGRATIEELIRRAELERVPADQNEARHLLQRAQRHLATADSTAEGDPEIAYDALYAAARKALTAILMEQGLRPTRQGGHEVVIEAAEAQLVPPLGSVLRPFRRLRRRRAQGDYLGASVALHADDIRADLPSATAIVDAAQQMLESGELTVFVPER